MEQLDIHIKVNPHLYNKDPLSSELGKKILSTTVNLLLEIGFEQITFKKMGELIGSNESSVYRYFENKHKLLLYLLNLYWSWMEYRLVFSITNVPDPEDQLRIALTLLTEEHASTLKIEHLKAHLIQRIMIAESTKIYHTMEVDNENKKGCYKPLKQVVQRISDIILRLNPNYKYPHMLVSTIIEGSNNQRYFAKHLPSLTDAYKNKGSITNFYLQLAINEIKRQ